MTKEEFIAVLALERRFLVETLSIIADVTYYIARVMESLDPEDVDQGPYRYEGMARCVREVTAGTPEGALVGLIDWYTISGR